jgi:hypothetical protein
MQAKNVVVDALQVRARLVFFLQWQKRDHTLSLSTTTWRLCRQFFAARRKFFRRETVARQAPQEMCGRWPGRDKEGE